ncbi:hypothetical protein Osc7112_5750 [Oscillatoria nigro-viridis PCC 7112]|uniref:Uncharacterized protein n=1 Tax=Phormidium nigroviride PCC 7112 TaxID=179408 RepID=K9VPT2_9CYAN|nr:hypothetical protein Osc7112_5750 [Oscillatoria nigro-viridis PCC 7112]
MSELPVLGLFNHRALPWLAESLKNADIDNSSVKSSPGHIS